MKNDYEVRGPITALMCEAPPKAGGGLIEIIIPTKKLTNIQRWPGTWYGFVHQNTGSIYIRGTKCLKIVEGYTSQQPLLHRVIAETPPGMNAVHKDGNTLNCTDDNLLNVRIGQTYDHTPVQPMRGVHWRQDKNKYETAAFHNGKRFNLGLFEKHKLAEANGAVEEFRMIGPTEYFKKHPKKGVK